MRRPIPRGEPEEYEKDHSYLDATGEGEVEVDRVHVLAYAHYGEHHGECD